MKNLFKDFLPLQWNLFVKLQKDHLLWSILSKNQVLETYERALKWFQHSPDYLMKIWMRFPQLKECMFLLRCFKELKVLKYSEDEILWVIFELIFCLNLYLNHKDNVKGLQIASFKNWQNNLDSPILLMNWLLIQR